MAVITFYTEGKEQAGNTTSTVCLATFLGIEEAQRNLLISTGLNDNTMDASLWPAKKERRSGLFGPNINLLSQSGMEELHRVIISNKLSPELVPNYTKVALKQRLELLNGCKGTKDEYREIQRNYSKVIELAKKTYNNVIVDLDKDLEMQTKRQILDSSDIVIALTTQKASNVKSLIEKLNSENGLLKKRNTIIALGRYDSKTRYSAKNLTRSFLKHGDTINTIPYNSLVFEALQEGKLIDLFLSFKKLKIEDENTFFVEELKRLRENIKDRFKAIQMGM